VYLHKLILLTQNPPPPGLPIDAGALILGTLALLYGVAKKKQKRT